MLSSDAVSNTRNTGEREFLNLGSVLLLLWKEKFHYRYKIMADPSGRAV